jgi:hypothetical protein
VRSLPAARSQWVKCFLGAAFNRIGSERNCEACAKAEEKAQGFTHNAKTAASMLGARRELSSSPPLEWQRRMLEIKLKLDLDQAR